MIARVAPLGPRLRPVHVHTGHKSVKQSYNRVSRAKQRVYDDDAYVLAAEQEKQVMADVYAQCVDNVLEMIAEHKQDVELANQLNSKADPREKVSENDANAATALVALLRTLAAGKEFADGLHYVAITSVISEREY